MKKLYELKNTRKTNLDAAQAALNSGDMELYNSEIAKATALNAQIEALEKIDLENSRFAAPEGDPVPVVNTVVTEPTQPSGNEYLNAFTFALSNGYNQKTGKNVKELEPLYNALSTGGGDPAGSDGGFLIPVEFNNAINEQRRQLVALADLFSVENVSGLTGWRAVDTAPTTGFTAVDELAALNEASQPSFTKVAYSLKKYGQIVPVSNELLTDNTAGLIDYLARWFAKKSIITENSALKALLDTLTASNLTVGKEVSAIKSVLNKTLDPDVALNAVIITNQSGFDFLDQLDDLNGRPLLQPDPTTGTPMLFKNKRVIALSDAFLPTRKVTTAGATKGDYYPIYVGDYKLFGTLFRRNMLDLASTNIGGDAWKKDQTEVRGILRLDAQKMDAAAAAKREIFVAAT